MSVSRRPASTGNATDPTSAIASASQENYHDNMEIGRRVDPTLSERRRPPARGSPLQLHEARRRATADPGLEVGGLDEGQIGVIASVVPGRAR